MKDLDIKNEGKFLYTILCCAWNYTKTSDIILVFVGFNDKSERSDEWFSINML